MSSLMVTNRKTADKIRGLSSCPDNVLFNPGVPIYITDLDMGFKRWVPPKSGRFVEWGPEDEYWARPLGIGTMEDADYIAYHVSDEFMEKYRLDIQDRILGDLGVPKGIIGDGAGSSYSGSVVAMELLMKRMG